ncbi:hypothetical protein SVAN01_09295 [Stagonosporopsis vannaccii]|nr:hypothetical protein SVAN01_09295 [Stagonosporopsis vannaccii]
MSSTEARALDEGHAVTNSDPHRLGTRQGRVYHFSSPKASRSESGLLRGSEYEYNTSVDTICAGSQPRHRKLASSTGVKGEYALLTSHFSKKTTPALATLVESRRRPQGLGLNTSLPLPLAGVSGA